MVAVLRTGQSLVAASFAVVALAYVGEALPPRWRSTGIGAMSTACLVAGILGEVYSQAVAEALGWRWVFGLAAPALAISTVAMAIVLLEPARSGPPVSWGRKYRELGALAVRRELALPYAANIPVLFSFVAMYAALGPLLQRQFGLGHGSVSYVRLAGLPALLLAPLAGWLVGRYGPVRIAVAGYLLAAFGLVAQAVSVAALWALVLSSVIFVLGIATIVPALIALIGVQVSETSQRDLLWGRYAVAAATSGWQPHRPTDSIRSLRCSAVCCSIGESVRPRQQRP
jgi:predicted MFS family arabinose efflux permease